jgi:hypothetical protein
VISGDTLVDFGQGLEINERWLQPGVTREEIAAGLRPLLELPVEHVLATHGGRTTGRSRARTVTLLDRPSGRPNVPSGAVNRSCRGSAVTGRRISVREPVGRRVSVLRKVRISLFERPFPMLALESVQGTILVAQLASGIACSASESADESPDVRKIARAIAMA